MAANPNNKKKGLATALYAPAMALKYINNQLEISDTQIEQRCGISRRTLSRIRAGAKIPRAYPDYMDAFVSLLNEKRRLYVRLGDTTRSSKIDLLLRDLLLVHCGLPTDAEIARNERAKKFAAP